MTGNWLFWWGGWINLRYGIRQHLRLGLKDVAIPVLVAGHAQGELSVSTASELKELADGDLLELDRGLAAGTWAGDSLANAGVVGCWVWTGCIDLVLRF